VKTLVFETPNKPIVIDQKMPEINDTEVLIRTRTVGICHSDYELLAGRYIIPISYPVTPGHEWCGEIVEVGKSVRNYKVGDRVVGECVVRTPERLHHFGFSMNGADREYFNVNPDWLHKLPDGVDDNRGALIEPFTCGFYAVLRSGGKNASETVVVIRGDFSDEDRVEGVAVDVDCLVDRVLAGCTEFNSAGGVDGEVPAGADGGVVDVSLDRGDREGPADLDRGGRSIGGFQR